MLTVTAVSQFKKDFKRVNKRRKDIQLLEQTIKKLCEEIALEEKYCDHALSGRYAGFRECHIQPDWLLVYKIDEERQNLVLIRTGSHSDLF